MNEYELKIGTIFVVIKPFGIDACRTSIGDIAISLSDVYVKKTFSLSDLLCMDFMCKGHLISFSTHKDMKLHVETYMKEVTCML